MLLCFVKGSCDIFLISFMGAEKGIVNGAVLGCGQDREGPLG